jgi:tetratricopeptide (TPR) repeat protein
VTFLESLETESNGLLNQDSPPLVEIRKAILEIEEFIASTEYSELSSEQRDRLQNLRKELKSRLRTQENQESDTSPKTPMPIEQSPSIQKMGASGRAENQQRDPLAEEHMEDAEKLFYGGRYAEAIKLFDRVLQIEPGWDRARQHRAESENYLRTGYIPPVALPSEAASAFGKAQSAARVGRYQDALNMLARAQSVLRDLGIHRWQEGLEFEQKLQENIDAENAYQEGLNLFKQGEVDDAIERVETASRATGLPKYSEKAGQFRQIRETLRSIHEILSALNLEPKMVAQAKADLDSLTAEHGDNPTFQRLRSRLEGVIPRAVAPLKDQARSLKAQAERADTLEETLYLARQAKSQLDQIRNLEGMDESLDRLQVEIERLINKIEEYEDELVQANNAYENNKRWPARAARLSQEVRQNYPGDPGVARLNRSLRSYFASRNLIKLVIVLLILLLIGLLGWWAINRFQAYLISLTPTPTYTATTTPMPSATPTLTTTPTMTPTSTTTPTPTTTPTVGVALRDIWARSSCYEGYNAVGRIPASGTLNFLQAERRFDQFNRECVLVEYQSESKNIIGWVLLVDIGSPGSTVEVSPTP